MVHFLRNIQLCLTLRTITLFNTLKLIEKQFTVVIIIIGVQCTD